MSRRSTSQILARRKNAVSRMQAHQAQSGVSSDLYWAQVDTLCQTLPRVEQEKTSAALEQGWLQWIGGTMPDSLPDYYTMWMYAFYLTEMPKSPNLLFIQAGSLIAKLEWGICIGDGPCAKEMLNLCMDKLSLLPKFETLTPKQKQFCQHDLMDILSRYVTPDGICTEPVRTFFLNHRTRYEQALEGLMAKLETQEPISNDPPPESAEATWEPIEADPDMVGLCAFLEKTSSAVYQRSLAQLYTLYRSPCNQSTGKLAQMALRDFFAALRALRIEPVDAQRFQTEFPDEYAQELRWRNGSTDYVMTACGWSCNDILVIRPVFQKIHQEGDR